MKDNFSAQAESYALYRPAYPDILFTWLNDQVSQKDCAWDCATGNGQIARGLAPFFKKVCATDISEKQLSNAVQADNIVYSKEAAEASSFAGHSFDLIVVAQAIHWFNFEKFYAEVRRTLKPGGVFVVTGYDVARITPAIDAIIMDFHENIVGPYWDAERKWVDEQYKTIPFPFREIITPQYAYEAAWDMERLLRYVDTWSAVQHYIRKQGSDPVIRLKERLETVWEPGKTYPVVFPILLRAGHLI